MFTVDKYLTKKFHIQHYNCWHFVRDVWFELTGHMLYDYTPAGTNRLDLELAAEDATRHFVKVHPLATSQGTPLIVLFQQPRTPPHIGVLYQGRVLHLRPQGARWEPIGPASVGFTKINFYVTK